MPTRVGRRRKRRKKSRHRVEHMLCQFVNPNQRIMKSHTEEIDIMLTFTNLPHPVVNTRRIPVLMLICFALLTVPAVLQAQYNGAGANDNESYKRPCPDMLELDIRTINASSAEAQDGSIDISVFGGEPPYSYCWSGRQFSSDLEDVQNLSAGAYQILVVDANKCDAYLNVEIGDSRLVSNVDPQAESFQSRIRAIAPNPSDGIIDIRYEVLQNAIVQIEIMDALGHVLAVPVNAHQSAGSYTFRYDGSLHTAGNYYCRLVTNNNAFTSQFVIVR